MREIIFNITDKKVNKLSWTKVRWNLDLSVRSHTHGSKTWHSNLRETIMTNYRWYDKHSSVTYSMCDFMQLVTKPVEVKTWMSTYTPLFYMFVIT